MFENTAFLIVLGSVAALFVLIFIGLVISRLYHRASKEISFVRTGFRGQKVIMNGGALVFPVLHEVIPVNMNTQRLEVQRGAEAALITRDRMRVDVRAEFYVRVKPNADAIADAAQTLGRRTTNPQALKELVEGKFVDALRAVAAGMSMEELHENRVDFVQKVQHAVSEDLLKNGLELESVSLTALDQTDQTFFNPNNAFDAQGLTRLTEEIEARRKQRNDIERSTQVQIHMKDLETEQKKLELDREEEYAKMMQAREIAVRRAEEKAATEREEAEKQREAEEARIAAKQRVDQAGILSERAVEEERIDKDRQLREREIGKARAVELADQDRAIAIAEKSKAQSQAEAEADKARAIAAKAEEQVVTSRETEIAERRKAIELVKAAEEAERDAIGVKVQAHADRTAAEDRAEAVRTQAQAEADKVRLEAEAAAERYKVDADGKRMLNEAENVLAPEIIEMQIKMTVVRNLEAIIRESVKPMERIDGIKIYQVEGLGGGGGGGGGTANGSSNGHASAGDGSLADQVVNSALRYRGQAPLLDSLLKEIGLTGTDLQGLGSAANITRDGSAATPTSDQAAQANPATGDASTL
ncbi:flotillin family protein [Phycisphaerales bacterium AB-hyl4]|uniref:Flotillin family protein n=1 Tax=Natronomicrosphaera hydrolytica TaxID=3242702 RepID=A0ABV4U9U1_9BACT